MKEMYMVKNLCHGQYVKLIGLDWTFSGGLVSGSGNILMSVGNHAAACDALMSFIPFDRPMFQSKFGLDEPISRAGYFPYFGSQEDLEKFINIVNFVWDNGGGWETYQSKFLDDFERKALGIERT